MADSPLLVIEGPTGVGKTAAAVALGARLAIEVVAADSRQVYRGMVVRTAKQTAEAGAGARACRRLRRRSADALARAGRRSGRGLCRPHPRPRAPRRAPALPCRGDGRRRPRGRGARAARARLRADAARDAGHRLSRVRARRRQRSRARRGAATDAAGHAALRAAAVDVVRARARALDRRRGRAGRRHRRGGRDRDDTRAGGPDRVRQRVNGGNRGGHEVGRERERAILAALRRPAQRRAEVEESLEELAGLTAAAGATVGQRVIQERQAATSSLYFGSGKVDEMAEAVRESGANLFISDDPLSPIQERNLSEALGIKVIDRTALILDIFAQRARSAEGKLQVELAQLTYLLPRLVGQWKHLERLGGGIGTRGPGETQLESDRRVIRRRVMRIRSELERVQVHRRLQRAGQRRLGLPAVAP